VKIDFQSAFKAPPGAREVLLVRHGAVTPPGPDGLIGGRSDPPLTEPGRAQAGAIADHLAGGTVTALFASHLQRATETAAVLGERLALETQVLEQLGEVYLGEWEGHGIHSRGASGDPEFLKMMEEQRWDLIPGAEPADAFAARVRDGLERVADAGRDGGVAVAVTHGAVVAELCRQVTGSEPFAFLQVTNGSLTRLVRMPDGRWRLLAFNETAHLREGR
jgi:2,3-bisphosphoglycerate-dependent phosphoglycerate mutase